MGWPTGLEPATTRITIWGSTIELRPPTRGETLRIGLLSVKKRPAASVSHEDRGMGCLTAGERWEYGRRQVGDTEQAPGAVRCLALFAFPTWFEIRTVPEGDRWI